MYTRVNPSFIIQKWDARGLKSHGHVILMVLYGRCLDMLRLRPKSFTPMAYFDGSIKRIKLVKTVTVILNSNFCF